MLEYEFEAVPASRGVFVGKTLGYREVILRRGLEGWRFAGWIPSQQVDGSITEIDLIFEREQGGEA